MNLLKLPERRFLEAVSGINYANPFLEDRITYERQALGEEFDEALSDWNLRGDDPEFLQQNAERIADKTEQLLLKIQDNLKPGFIFEEPEKHLYEDGVYYLLYYRFARDFFQFIQTGSSRERCPFFLEFKKQWEFYFPEPVRGLPGREDTTHMFAVFYQVRRAFYYIFRYIMGRSQAAAGLRAEIWRSVFSHSMRRYRTTLFSRMQDYVTLITGPTGSGKELAARAIGLSGYIPFDPIAQSFDGDTDQRFLPINLSALPSTLVESELFGHRKGAFTGALADRRGWLALCPVGGAVFLDEIGELDPVIQVKLLRVLQSRTFVPLGSQRPVPFNGRIIAATNRNLVEATSSGQFREDFYYRLCSDVVSTPPLSSQIDGSEEALKELVSYISQRLTGEPSSRLVEEVMDWIVKQLGLHYSWPGNFRELEQCVRSILIREEYRPPDPGGQKSDDFVRDQWNRVEFSLDELTKQYCLQAYRVMGSYGDAARKLGVNWRTVKKHVLGE